MSDYYDIFRTRELHKGRDNLRLRIIDPSLKIIGERKQGSNISFSHNFFTRSLL